MVALHLHANGPARPERVWREYVEPARWPGWSPQIRRAELDDHGTRLTAGATGRVWPVIVPVPLTFTVLDVNEAERYWIWRVGSGAVHVDLTHDVAATPGGSRTSLRIDARPLLFPMVLAYAPLAQAALKRLVRQAGPPGPSAGEVTAESQHSGSPEA